MPDRQRADAVVRPRAAALACLVAVAACSKETRPVGAALPRTPPAGPADPRIEQYQQNAYQLSQGSRYYAWYGCAGCHASSANGSGPDFGLGQWRHGDGFDAVYAFIAQGHRGDALQYGDTVPVEQLWQITAYVRDLAQLDPAKRRRQDLDAVAEPHDRQGPAPLR